MNLGGIVNQKDIDYLTSRDKIIAGIFKLYGQPPDWSRKPGFISLSKIILEQQVSLASANAHFQKLNNYLSEFTPLNILDLTDDEMKSCQISRQKAKYLKALSTAIVSSQIDLLNLSNLGESEIRVQLTAIKGIGHWTTDIYLMFCMQFKDIFPIGDIAIVKTVKELAKVHGSDEILSIARHWKPFRSLAAYFLWHYYLMKRHKH
jgi:DNA-3-methyladenine glycosylase II